MSFAGAIPQLRPVRPVRDLIEGLAEDIDALSLGLRRVKQSNDDPIVDTTLRLLQDIAWEIARKLGDGAARGAQIRVIIIDDHPLALVGLTALVQSAPEIVLAGQACGADAAIALLQSTAPDLAIIDISESEAGCARVVEQAAKLCPGVRLLIVAPRKDRAFVQSMLQFGAAGYLLKRSAASDLIVAIRAIRDRGVYVDPDVAGLLVESIAQYDASTVSVGLSKRELDVIKLSALGHTNKDIAHRFSLSSKSIETYKRRATRKLGIKTRSEMIRYAALRGWIPTN